MEVDLSSVLSSILSTRPAKRPKIAPKAAEKKAPVEEAAEEAPPAPIPADPYHSDISLPQHSYDDEYTEDVVINFATQNIYDDEECSNIINELSNSVRETEELFEEGDNTFLKKEKKKTEKWTAREDLRLLKGLSQFGLDFTLITDLFPGRERSAVLARYKHLKVNRSDEVSKALLERKEIDVEKFSKLAAKSKLKRLEKCPVAPVVEMEETFADSIVNNDIYEQFVDPMFEDPSEARIANSEHSSDYYVNYDSNALESVIEEASTKTRGTGFSFGMQIEPQGEELVHEYD